MPGERQLAQRSEYPHAVIGTRVVGLRYERGLAQVGPARKGGHARIAQPIGIKHHGQRIAQQRIGAEDVDLQEGVGRHGQRFLGGMWRHAGILAVNPASNLGSFSTHHPNGRR